MDINSVWEQFDQFKEGKKKTSQEEHKNEPQNVCSQCESSNIHVVNNELICCDCGLVLNSILCDHNYDYKHEQAIAHHSKTKYTNKSISKMQNWYMWSNEEKNTYKLSMYTKNLCSQLDINESLIPNICDTVINVMETIKKFEGTKRARVKDGIIITCIQYVFKDTHNNISINNLIKKINLDTKYVTKAEKIVIELINSGKLKLKKTSVLDVKQPFDYVQEVIHKRGLKIPTHILKEIKQLIHACEKYDLLLDHTPLSVGVCCFYYVIKARDIAIDIKLFSEIYNLSVVTVIKTYNKLKQHEDFLKLNNIIL